MGNEKLVGILDLQQITFKNVDARGLITGFQFLQVTLSLSFFQIWEFSAWNWDVQNKSRR